MITASRLELAIKCSGSFALEHRDVRVSGSDPERGKVNHAEHQATIDAGDVPEDLESRWPGFTWLAEVKVCYDLANDTGEIFGYGSDRGYADRGPFVVFGTADVVGRLGDRVAIVDRKGFNKQTAASENPQVAILALGVTRAWGLREADVAIAPEIGRIDVATLGALELDAFAAQAKDAVAAVLRARDARRNGLPIQLNEGPHCLYCPAVGACPLKQALALQLRGDAALRLDLSNDNVAADAVDFAAKVRMLLKQLDGAIEARVNARPIPLNNGRVLARVPSQGNETLDGDTVHRVVSDLHGRAIADAAVVRSATKKRLKEALGFAGVSSVPKAEREVLEAVRAAGGASRKDTTSIEEVEPVRLLAAGDTPPQGG